MELKCSLMMDSQGAGFCLTELCDKLYVVVSKKIGGYVVRQNAIMERHKCNVHCGDLGHGWAQCV